MMEMHSSDSNDSFTIINDRASTVLSGPVNKLGMKNTNEIYDKSSSSGESFEEIKMPPELECLGENIKAFSTKDRNIKKLESFMPRIDEGQDLEDGFEVINENEGNPVSQKNKIRRNTRGIPKK